jgi:hypothetical protein
MVVGKWWNNNIEVVEVDDMLIAIDGWNGMEYTSCFRVNPFDYTENERDGKIFYSYIGNEEYMVGVEYGEYLEDDENDCFATDIIGYYRI